MNAQEAILKIKALFEDAPMTEPVVPSEPKVEMMEYSLADGTKVMIDKLEVGGKVTLEDGSNAPLGEHQLADGTMVQVDEAGVIIELSSPKEDIVPEEAPVEAKQDMRFDELASKFNQVLAFNESLQNRINELEGKVKQGFESVASLIEALSINPTADPVQKPNSFKAYVSTNDIKEQRINKFRNAILNK